MGAELRAYAKFVGVGSYLIAEDTVSDLFRAGDGAPLQGRLNVHSTASHCQGEAAAGEEIRTSLGEAGDASADNSAAEAKR